MYTRAICDFHRRSEVYLLHVLGAQKQASEHQTCGPSGPLVWPHRLGPWGQGWASSWALIRILTWESLLLL